MTDTSTPKAFKCGCGQFKATLAGPPVANMTCHCHSCVGSARFIDENHGKDGKGISNIDDTKGAAFAFYKLGQVDFGGNKDPRESLGVVKVGDKGEFLRYYAKCCGTPTFMTSAKCTSLGLNRNALFNDDEGKMKYTPATTPLNIMTKYCFGSKDDIPDPKVDMINLSAAITLFPFMISTSLGFGAGKNKFAKRDEDLDRAEVVPITWE